MPLLTRSLLLQALAKHHRLTAADFANPDITGLPPDEPRAGFLLHQLLIGGKILAAEGVHPVTYTLAVPVTF